MPNSVVLVLAAAALVVLLVLLVRPDWLPPPGGLGMKKSEQIKALEHDLDQLVQQVDRLAVRVKALETPPAPVQPQPFADRVRSELHDRWGWLLEAAGL